MQKDLERENLTHLNKKEAIVIGLICLLLGFTIGYASGVGWALNWGVTTAMAFAEKQGINITLNAGMISTALYQYKNNLGGCLFTNASIHYD